MIIDALTFDEKIVLGKQGENLAKTITFDCKDWLGDMTGGTLSLVAQRPTDEGGYPVPAQTTEDTLTWTVNSTDVAIDGIGYAELRYTIGEQIIKSQTFLTEIKKGLTPKDEPPEAYVPYINEVLRISKPPLLIEAGANMAEVVAGEHYPVLNDLGEVLDAISTGRPLILHGKAYVDGVLAIEAFSSAYSSSISHLTEMGIIYQILFLTETWRYDTMSEDDITTVHYELVAIPLTGECYIRQIPKS